MKKRCFKCGRLKLRRLFYRHPMMADGLLGKCKSCTKKDVRQRRVAKHRVACSYDRRRAKTQERRRYQLEAQRKRNRKFPGKHRARVAVGNAIRDGRLKRLPCRKCGTRKKVQAHHRDYRRPLVVDWLCFRCHREGEHGQKVEVNE